MGTDDKPDDVISRGRLILAGLLLVYHPALSAVRVTTEIASLAVRGTPLAIGLVARLLVAAVCFAAGRALIGRTPGADGLAQAALFLSCGLDMVVYFTTIFPNNRMPGDTPFYVVASLLYHAGWLIYLRRATRPESP